jgi:spore coat polysaccharide biosynthesis protein SpsF
MEALNFIPAEIRILACPEDAVSSFSPLAEEAGFSIIAGPKEDVLARFCLAIRHFGIRHIIRATGDNPFVFTDAAASIYADSVTLKADFAGYYSLPLGAGVESVTAQSLLRAEKSASSAFDREHVCPYLYSHPELFRLHRPMAPLIWQDGCVESDPNAIKLSVDTQEDYERAQELYASLGHEPLRYRGQTILKRYREIFYL